MTASSTPGVADRVEAVHSPGGDGHGGAFTQCSAMRAGVDAEGSTGDDEAALRRHPRGQGGRYLLTVPGGGPGPHQRQAQPVGRPCGHPLLAHGQVTGPGDHLAETGLAGSLTAPIGAAPAGLGAGSTAAAARHLPVLGADQQRRVAAHPQAEGRVLELAESRWPPGVSGEDEAPTEAVEYVPAKIGRASCRERV